MPFFMEIILYNMEWRNVKGYEGIYKISEYGDLLSIKRLVRSRFGSKRSVPEKMKNFRLFKGYKTFELSKNGINKTMFAHTIVCLNYINTERKETVNHIDGNKLNNHYSNLEWCSISENLFHARQTGLSNNNGELQGGSKLKNKDINTIIDLNKNGYSQRKIANMYSVSQKTIFNIIHKKKWKSIIEQV